MDGVSATHPLWLVVGAAAISFVPLLLGMLTCYLKVSIVLSMIRNAIGAGQIPGAVIVMAVSLSITVFIMGGVIEQSSERLALVNEGMLISAPSAEKIKILSSVLDPWKKFLIKHTNQRELEVLWEAQASGSAVDPIVEKQTNVIGSPTIPPEIPLRILIPAFILTELKEAFSMGFVLLLPFLAIDLIVANVLAGMGMFMLSPAMVALPLKLILFVLSDAWLLITKGLISSYQI